MLFDVVFGHTKEIFIKNVVILPPRYTAIPIIPSIPSITSTMDIPSRTPHRLRLNFLLCSRFKLTVLVEGDPEECPPVDHNV